jgi:cyclic beta-1,2-glucan synthetase
MRRCTFSDAAIAATLAASSRSNHGVAARDHLDPSHQRKNCPLRATLARYQPTAGGGPGFFPRLHDNLAMLRQAHAYLAQPTAQASDNGPAAEWLLDNFHTIEAQLQLVHRDLPRSFYRRLPVLVQAPLAGLPRIYGVAWAFVAHTDSAFDPALLQRFLAAYQQRRALNLAELWALPTTLRAVLVENLRRLAERLATHRAACDLADLCAQQVDQHSAHSLDRLSAAMEQRGVQTVFMAQLMRRLPP